MEIWAACDFRLLLWSLEPPAAALDFSSGSRPDLLFRVLLAALPGKRADRYRRHSAGAPIPADDRAQCVRSRTILVRPFALLDLLEFDGYSCVLLDRVDCLGTAGAESLAARHAGDLPALLFGVCECVRRFLVLSVGWDVAGGRIYLALLRATGLSSRTRRIASSVTREFVPVAVGVAADLLRIRNRETGERRSAMAQLDRDGRVLPERPAAHMDRLVLAAPAARFPRLHRGRDPGAGVGIGMDDPAAAPLPDRTVLPRDRLGDRGHCDGELCVLELPGLVVGNLVGG